MSILSSVMRANLKAISRVFRPDDIAASRALQDRLGEISAQFTSREVERSGSFKTGGALSAWCSPKSGVKSGCILYLHGGGYTAGGLQYALGFGSVLAAETGRRVLCAAYRLAPENPFPAALDDALAAYEHLLGQGCASEEVVLCGESAGGGLIMALTMRLRDMGLPMPGALAAISPWTDLTLSGRSHDDNRRTDPSLSKECLAHFAEVYSNGEDLRNPYLSPLYGDFSGFPPSLIFAGSDEILLSDAIETAKKMAEHGVDIRLHTEPEMWHAYVLYGVSEAKYAMSILTKFIEKVLDRV